MIEEKSVFSYDGLRYTHLILKAIGNNKKTVEDEINRCIDVVYKYLKELDSIVYWRSKVRTYINEDLDNTSDKYQCRCRLSVHPELSDEVIDNVNCDVEGIHKMFLIYSFDNLSE